MDTEVKNENQATDTLDQEGTQPAQKTGETDIDYAKRIKEVESGAKKVAEKANKYEREIAHTNAVKSAYREIRKDSSYLIKLAKDSPQVAKDVCEEYYDMTLSQALARIAGDEEPSKDSEESDKMLATYISDFVESELEDMDDGQREKVQEEYDDIVSGKRIESIKDAKKYLSKAKQLAGVQKKSEEKGSSIMGLRGKEPTLDARLGNNSKDSYKKLRALAIESHGKEKADRMYPPIPGVTE